MTKLLHHISQKISTTILSSSPLSGGDISNVYILETKVQKFVLKTNKSPQALMMFQVEQIGLEAIAATKTIATPQILLCDIYQGTAFLLMEYIATKRPDNSDFQRLGIALGQLHQITNISFGWRQDNFIGSLPQSNSSHNSWLDFYIFERLLPQFQLAKQKQLLSPKEIPTKNTLLKKGKALFKNSQPSLLHGDLWNGNFLIARDGTPFLIDPAVYYGHAEVDIAMTHLFGGFGAAFYTAYYELHPPNKGAAIRQDWYQLYYLLVHLNMFGRGYYGQIKQILNNI